MNKFGSISLGAILLGMNALSALAAPIVDQQPNAPSDPITSQTFPSLPTFSSQAFDDFTLSQSYNIGKLTVYGSEGGSPNSNTAVTAQIWNGPPGTGSLVQSVSGSEVNGDLQFDFAGLLLSGGTYWVSAFVTRDFSPGGQWFWDTHTPVTGSQAQWWNPGGAFGQGTAPITVASAFGSTTPLDIAFTLEGTAAGSVPEPGSLALVGIAFLGVLAAARTKKMVV